MSDQKVEIKEGDTVQSKGKHGKELQGTVIKVAGRYCKVELGNGTIETILKKDVKNVFETSTRRRATRTQARKETQKSSRSESRSKSRSRSRSRNRNVVPKYVSKKRVENAVPVKKDTSLSSSVGEDIVVTRTSTRTSSKIKLVNKVHQSTQKPSAVSSEVKKLIVSSDSEPESAMEKESEIKIQPKKQYEIKMEKTFKFHWTVFWILQFFFMPLVAILVHLTCTKSHCTLTEAPHFPKHWSSYFDLQISIIYAGWIILQGALMFVPFGNLVKSFSSSERNIETILKYRLNGFIALLVNCVICGILAYLQQPLDIIYSKFLQLMIASIIFSILFTLILHIRRFLKRKDMGIMNMQAEEFSFFGKILNIKVYCYRLGMLAWVSVNLCLLYKNCFKDNIVNFSLLTSAACQLFYVSDMYWREETLLTTESFQQHELDYFTIIRVCTFVPFISVIPLVYIINYPKSSNNWSLIGLALILFACGYWIYLKSSREKHIYLKNPHDPSIAYVKRILPSLRQKQEGLLDYIRHCNYLGEFLMHVAWTLPCGFHHVPPYIPAFLTFMYLTKSFMKIEKIHTKEYFPVLNRHQKEIH